MADTLVNMTADSLVPVLSGTHSRVTNRSAILLLHCTMMLFLLLHGRGNQLMFLVFFCFCFLFFCSPFQCWSFWEWCPFPCFLIHLGFFPSIVFHSTEISLGSNCRIKICYLEGNFGQWNKEIHKKWWEIWVYWREIFDHIPWKRSIFPSCEHYLNVIF